MPLVDEFPDSQMLEIPPLLSPTLPFIQAPVNAPTGGDSNFPVRMSCGHRTNYRCIPYSLQVPALRMDSPCLPCDAKQRNDKVQEYKRSMDRQRARIEYLRHYMRLATTHNPGRRFNRQFRADVLELLGSYARRRHYYHAALRLQKKMFRLRWNPRYMDISDETHRQSPSPHGSEESTVTVLRRTSSRSEPLHLPMDAIEGPSGRALPATSAPLPNLGNGFNDTTYTTDSQPPPNQGMRTRTRAATEPPSDSLERSTYLEIRHEAARAAIRPSEEPWRRDGSRPRQISERTMRWLETMGLQHLAPSPGNGP